MKLNAKKFAVAIWTVAAALVVTQLFADVYRSSSPINDVGRVLVFLLFSLLNPAILAALGAGIHLLGEIRDRLPERSN
jgi:hypothetical protein